MKYHENDIGDVDFKDLVFNILYRWRGIVGVAIALAILFGGIKTVKGFVDLRNSTGIEQVRTKYQTDYELYQASKQSYESEIKLMTSRLQEFNNYMQKSVLMQVSPYNRPVATADIYIRTDYKIMPGMVYQNNDYTDSIVKMYATAIGQNGLSNNWEDIMPGIDKDYISELVGASVDYDSDMIHIVITHPDLDFAQKSLDRILQNISDYSDHINEKIGSHEVEILNKESFYTVDTGLLKSQNDKRDSQAVLQKDLAEKTKQLKNLEEPVYRGLTKSSILKDGIRYGVLGGILGIFVAGGFVLLKILTQDKILSAKEIRYYYDIPILGVAKRRHSSGLMGKVDCCLDRAYQGNVELDSDHLYPLSAANINNYSGKAKRLVLVGAAGDEVLKMAMENLCRDLENIELIYGGNIALDVDALKQISNTDAIIMIEKRGVSNRGDILRTLDIAEATGKTIIGCILF